MKNIRIKIFYIIVFAIVFVNTNEIRAIQATPDLVTITLPDSSKVEVYIKGDENIHWFESADKSDKQFTLLKNNEGYFVYATQNVNGDLIPSKHRYWGNDVKIKASKERIAFLEKLKPKLFYSKRQIENFITEKKPNISNKNKDKLLFSPVNIEGTRKYLVILMSYTDLQFTKTREDFDRSFNETGYQDNGYGSVKDFYIQQSYKKFTPEFVVVGPYQTKYNAEYYKTNSRALALEAVNNAIYEVNMIDFDNDDDGYVDAINIIFAGWGEEAGYSAGIWSHASQLVDDYGSSPIIGNKYIRRYCCSPELRGNSGNRISPIGVSAHEFCHTLGAPDYYDVNYGEGGSYQGAGNWCLMSNGSWNSSGDCPAGINIFQKWLYSWVSPIDLTTDDVSITNMPNSAHNPVAYRMYTDTPDEFYIMENRQKIGFDKYVSGHGLLIWHVHSTLSEYLLYGYNAGNSTHPQMMYPVCASSSFAQPNAESYSYGNINSDGTPFPGTSNKTEFNDNSIPASISWNGKHINRPISNISEVDSFINFNYTGRPVYVFNIPYFYNCNNTAEFSYYTTISSAGTGWRRIQEINGNNTIELRSFNSSDTSHQEHYLLLPALQLYKNYAYSFDIKYKVYSNIYPGNMKLYLCNTKNINDKILIEDFGETLGETNFTKLPTASFNIYQDGIYYIAICSYTKGDYMDLYIDDIDIKGNVGIVEDIDDSNINIYPNPAKNNIYIINLSNESINDIEIIGIDGKSMLTIKDTNIDISNLNQGTYIVKVNTKNKTHIKSIIKE